MLVRGDLWNWMLRYGMTSQLKMVERVLSFLPVPVLCRYRTVCNPWNRLIWSPEFGAQQEAAVKREVPSFLAMQCERSLRDKVCEAWCFLELDQRQRWYIIEGKHSELPKPMGSHLEVAMDGGLVCRYVNPTNDGESPCFSILVYNPIAKAVKVLPSVPRHQKSQSFAELTLAVDDKSKQFKIFLINEYVCASPAGSLEVQNYDPLMCIYDSATDEWQGSTDPFCVSSHGVGHVSSNLVFQGFLYALFGISRGCWDDYYEDEIWRYNIGEDMWEMVNVNNLAVLLYPRQHQPLDAVWLMLFMSINHLFQGGWQLEYTVHTV